MPGMAELLDNIKPSDINKVSEDMGEGGAAAVSFADAGEIAKLAADVGDLSLLAGEDLASLVAAGGTAEGLSLDLPAVLDGAASAAEFALSVLAVAFATAPPDGAQLLSAGWSVHGDAPMSIDSTVVPNP